MSYDGELWRWRFKSYDKARLSEIVRSVKPGEETERELAAMAELATRAVERRNLAETPVAIDSHDQPLLRQP